MNALQGPVRLLMIQSGVYDFAEVELDKPLHLVGANNSGKSTLINALQFLYVDNFQRMHFPKDPNATKKYYFPHANSFILFECLTELGRRVVGVRGLGPTQGYQFQRFTYQGGFRKEDYFEGRKLRQWNDIRDRIVARDYRKWEAQDLRRSLLGNHRDAPLNLVPLDHSARYGSFCTVFRNLLRLAHIPASKIEAQLIDIHQGLLRSTELDLQTKYAELYRDAREKSKDVERLQENAPLIEETIGLFEKQASLRAKIGSRWARLQRIIERKRRQHQRKVANLTDQIDARQEEAKQVSDTLDELRQTQKEHERQIGKLQSRLADLNRMRERCREVDPQRLNDRIDQTNEQRDELSARLGNLSERDHDEVADDRDEQRAKLERDRASLEDLEDAVISQLRDTGALEDREIRDIFRLINPRLLSTPVSSSQGERRGSDGGGGIEVEDRESLISRLRGLAKRIGEDGYSDESITIPSSIAPDAPTLDAYGDPEVIRKRIKKRESKLERLERLLRDIAKRQELEDKFEALDEQRESLESKRREWREWKQAEDDRPKLRTRLEEQTERANRLNSEINDLEDRRDTLKETVSDLRHTRKKKKDELKQLDQKFSQLPPPLAEHRDASANTDADAEAPPSDEAAVSELIDAYTTLHERVKRTERQFEKNLTTVEQKTGANHVGADDAETVEQLREVLDALGERRAAAENLWEKLVNSLRNELKALLDGLRELRKQVNKLNRALDQRQISNLTSFELEIAEDRQFVDKLKKVRDRGELPLLTDDEESTRAIRELASLLEAHPKLRLEELFQLRFRVEDASGEVKPFNALEQIESQGTTTTSKVLVHLELLRMMLPEDRARIPFFLDEVSILDDQNLTGIVDHASTMGFIPVVASPDARECVDTLYYLPSDGESVHLAPDVCRVQIQRPANDSEGRDEPIEEVAE